MDYITDRERKLSRVEKLSVKMTLDDSLLLPASRQLTEREVEAFQESFSISVNINQILCKCLFDHQRHGRINCDEFLQTLRRVGMNISEQVARDFIVSHDENGNGELDFEEYLNFMTNEEIFIDLVDDLRAPNKHNYKDILLYEVMSKFLTRSCLKENQKDEIVGYYRRKLRSVTKRGSMVPAVHVVKHYAAGARSHTLTEREILQQIEAMRRLHQSEDDEKIKNSPYADPIQLILSLSASQKERRDRPKQPGWSCGWRLTNYGVKLPKIDMKEQKTFERLHDIRKKIEDAKVDYYWNLKRAQHKNSYEIWKSLHVAKIPTKRLRDMMKEIYGTYTTSRLSGCRIPYNKEDGLFRPVIAPNTSLS